MKRVMKNIGMKKAKRVSIIAKGKFARSAVFAKAAIDKEWEIIAQLQFFNSTPLGICFQFSPTDR